MTEIARNEQAPWRRGLDGVIVFPPEATDPIWVGAPGDTIIALAAAPIGRDELVEQVVTRFTGDPDRIRAETRAFTDRLIELGVLVER